MKNSFIHIVTLIFVLFFVSACEEYPPGHSERLQVEEEPICRHILHDHPVEKCNAELLWSEIAEQKTESPLSSERITLFVDGDPVDRVGQLWNEGFVPPGRDVEPWPFVLPVDWSADPFNDRNWQFHLHAWRMIDPLIVAWEDTSEDRYLLDALEIMIDWHDFHFTRQFSSNFQWYDMSVGLRTMKLAYVLDRVLRQDVQTELKTRQKLVHLAHTHVESLTDSAQLSSGNHGLFQLHGLMALCLVLPEVDTCQDFNKYVKREMKDLLLRQFSGEGVHLEHSPEYHFFALNTVGRMLKTGWYDHFDFVQELMGRAGQNRFWMVHPDSTMVTVGDSEPKQIRLDFPDGKEQCRDMVWNHDYCLMLKSFEETGYVMVRSDWAVPKDKASMLFFMASFHSSAHKLPDDLSIEWYDRGERILTNAGKYSYNQDQWRDYVSTTRAHNTVEIDRATFSRRRDDAYGSAITLVERHGDIFLIQGKVDHKWNARAFQSQFLSNMIYTRLGTIHERTLIYKPGQWLAVVDNMNSWRNRDFTQWFHFAPHIHLRSSGGKHIATTESGQKIFIKNSSDETEVHLAKGQEDPFIQGWTTKTYGRMEPRYSLGFTLKGRQQNMITYFAFSLDALKDAQKSLPDLTLD